MPFIKEIHIPTVTHIGFLNREKADLNPSRDGPGLAVSDCPDAWRQISRSNAPDVILSHSAALWVDALSFSPNCIVEIQDWARDAGYLEPCQVWHANWTDDETGAFREETCASYEAALAHTHCPEAIMQDNGWCLGRRALKRLGRWGDPLNYHNGILILYTREVIIPKRPLICGIWWCEPLDLASGIAPSGQLMPEALEKFDVEDEDGDFVPFKEAFPDYVPIGARPSELLWD